MADLPNRAAVLHGVGDLRIEELPRPELPLGCAEDALRMGHIDPSVLKTIVTFAA